MRDREMRKPRTDLVETTLVREDGNVSVVACAACCGVSYGDGEYEGGLTHDGQLFCV